MNSRVALSTAADQITPPVSAYRAGIARAILAWPALYCGLKLLSGTISTMMVMDITALILQLTVSAALYPALALLFLGPRGLNVIPYAITMICVGLIALVGLSEMYFDIKKAYGEFIGISGFPFLAVAVIVAMQRIRGHVASTKRGTGGDIQASKQQAEGSNSAGSA